MMLCQIVLIVLVVSAFTADAKMYISPALDLPTINAEAKDVLVAFSKEMVDKGNILEQMEEQCKTAMTAKGVECDVCVKSKCGSVSSPGLPAQILQGLSTAAKTVANGLEDSTKAIEKFTTEAAKSFSREMTVVIDHLNSALKKGLAEPIQKVLNTLENSAQGFATGFIREAKAVEEKLTEAVNKIKTLVTNIWNDIEKTATKIFSGMVDFFKNLGRRRKRSAAASSASNLDSNKLDCFTNKCPACQMHVNKEEAMNIACPGYLVQNKTVLALAKGIEMFAAAHGTGSMLKVTIDVFNIANNVFPDTMGTGRLDATSPTFDFLPDPFPVGASDGNTLHQEATKALFQTFLGEWKKKYQSYVNNQL